jgi:hypothetical protein
MDNTRIGVALRRPEALEETFLRQIANDIGLTIN